jgi:hypothetical protein
MTPLIDPQNQLGLPGVLLGLRTYVIGTPIGIAIMECLR